ncbi:hypothetical protein [Propioniciclava sp.]|uniref:hypothetical protein n=1 Tax=Propioniciclava sp. TaxID=2038686 RepID=UPI0026164CDF|nr:hypothetical protein [Propioniciclava sp.]
MTQPEQPTIGTVVAQRDATINPRTGEPARPWSIWAATALLYTGTALVFAGLGVAFWVGIDIASFNSATWLHSVVPAEPGSLVRVALVTGEFVIAMLVGAGALIAGYYGWWGYRWSRWAGLVAVAVALGALVLNPLAYGGIAAIAVGAGLLWLPGSQAFLTRWHVRRNPAPPEPTIVDDVYYGPLPRYR